MSHPVVVTTGGTVRGAASDGVRRFLGIPYAAAPTGARRFDLPAPHPGWSGERDATRIGPNAPQMGRAFPLIDLSPLVGDGWREGDDYLTANVWTPEGAAGGLPVMVFIHGGAWIGGAGDCAAYDGTAFARSGVVLVAISYRLGFEGLAAFAGGVTNLCLHDMIAALRWVSRNAEAFGGDPDNVTVFGESAGAMSIGNLVASPLAQGLFRRAILQSGHGSMLGSRRTAGAVAARMAQALGVEATLEGFRSASVEACVKGADALMQPTSGLDMREDGGKDPTMGLSRFRPLVGDDVVPTPSLAALAAGAGEGVELLVGSCLDEMNLYFAPTGMIALEDPDVAMAMLSAVQPDAAGVLAAYSQASAKPGEALTRAMTDLAFRDPVRAYALAHRGRAHVYEFGWRSPALDGTLGACHALELPFVFNTLASCTGPNGIVGEHPPQALADHVHAIWVRFAHDGSLPWPSFDADSRQVYRLDRQTAAHEPELPAARYR